MAEFLEFLETRFNFKDDDYFELEEWFDLMLRSRRYRRYIRHRQNQEITINV